MNDLIDGDTSRDLESDLVLDYSKVILGYEEYINIYWEPYAARYVRTDGVCMMMGITEMVSTHVCMHACMCV